MSGLDRIWTLRPAVPCALGRLGGAALCGVVLAAVALAGCGDASSSGGDASDAGAVAEPRACLVVAAAEFGTAGGVTLVDPVTQSSRPLLTTVHHDATLTVADDRVYVVNRAGAGGDNVQALDVDRSLATAWQYSVGPGANPWHLAPTGPDRAVVTRYDTADLVAVDLTAASTDAFVVGDPVPLPSELDADGRAEPGFVVVHDGVAWVALQGLDDYPWCALTSTGALVAYDAATLERRTDLGDGGVIPLRACNPGDFALSPDGELWIAHAGNHRSLDGTGGRDTTADDGGLELVDLAAATSLGLVLSESDFGGRDLLDLAIGADERLWVTLANADFSVSVHPVHLTAADPIGAPVYEADGVFDLLEHDDTLWVADRTPGRSGLVAIDATTGEVRTAAPIDTGYPPVEIAVVSTTARCGAASLLAE